MSKISYDPDVKVLNITLNKRKIINSEMSEDCILDYDKEGNLIGIEVLEVEPADIRSIKKEKNSKKKIDPKS